MFNYTAYGLYIRSYIKIPEFTSVKRHVIADIIIDLGERSKTETPAGQVFYTQMLPDGVRFTWSGVATYDICNGSSITVRPEKGITVELERQALHGYALAAILQQRQLLVLHGSAVEIGGRAVIVVGPKGHGKSTLVTYLHKQGHSFISDDISAVLMSYNEPVVLPGVPLVKLWPSALPAVGLAGVRLPKLNSKTTKRIYILKEKLQKSVVPLAAVVTLGTCKENIQFVPKQKYEKMLWLTRCLYFSKAHHAFSLGCHRLNFQYCSRLVKNIPILHMVRPSNLELLGQTCKTLRDNILRLE